MSQHTEIPMPNVTLPPLTEDQLKALQQDLERHRQWQRNRNPDRFADEDEKRDLEAENRRRRNGEDLW